jgi:hypothetical protein
MSSSPTQTGDQGAHQENSFDDHELNDRFLREAEQSAAGVLGR